MSLIPPLRVRIVSDFHVDVTPTALRLAPGADVLIVAGDTSERLQCGFVWLRDAVPMPTSIMAVAGNHERSGGVLPNRLADAPALAAAGILFLEDGALEDGAAVLGGIHVLDCTL